MAVPGFVRLADTGELTVRCERAAAVMGSCTLCPRECGVDRSAGELGYCRAGPIARVYRHMAHEGEEPPISASRGSGTIFFAHCTMACRYCQNYLMSDSGRGRDRSADELADMMVSLAGNGCHNINLVSASHYIPSVLEALSIAARRGVALPVVWNSSGYESTTALDLLSGVVDIYLADIRYSSGDFAAKYSDAPDYVEVNRQALKEMNRQVGILELDEEGAAVRGLIVRHLVLPCGVSGTREAMDFIAHELGPGTRVSLMAQYYPAHRAREHEELARRITREEWDGAVAALGESGLGNGWVQQYHERVSPIAGTGIAPDEDVPA